MLTEKEAASRRSDAEEKATLYLLKPSAEPDAFDVFLQEGNGNFSAEPALTAFKFTHHLSWLPGLIKGEIAEKQREAERRQRDAEVERRLPAPMQPDHVQQGRDDHAGVAQAPSRWSRVCAAICGFFSWLADCFRACWSCDVAAVDEDAIHDPLVAGLVRSDKSGAGFPDDQTSLVAVSGSDREKESKGPGSWWCPRLRGHRPEDARREGAVVEMDPANGAVPR